MIARQVVLIFAIMAFFVGQAPAQEATEPPAPIDRSATGGASTLEDILARQRGEGERRENRSLLAPDDGTAAGAGAGLLGTLGASSDSLIWEGLRFGTADVTVSTDSPAAGVLMQDAGMQWLAFREGPLKTYGGYLLLGTLGALVLFFLLRGKIRISHGRAGSTIERFKPIERFGHWLLAGSFILLGITGLLSLFGRTVLIPAFGKEANSVILIYSKWVHNNVSWAFMLALILVFVFWVIHNLPSRHDLVWFAKGGGIIGKSHPPAKKFNAGQKIIFWSVILLGGSISASGIALLFPFEYNMFAPTFAKLNAFGVPGLVGMAPLPETLAPHQEMQLAQAWHAIVSFVLMAIVIAHIYIGSVGMEGAYAAMGSGQVDLNWAKEHHSLWVDEVQAKEGAAPPQATPAE